MRSRVRSFIASYLFFFFNNPAPTVIYTLSLHDALPISTVLNTPRAANRFPPPRAQAGRHDRLVGAVEPTSGDRKSTRLNSSHQIISYAVFCLKKKIVRLNLCLQIDE